jgi:hypothetical protein
MGNRLNEWQAIDAVLPLFGKSVSKARRRYRHFVEQGIALGRRPELIGGGLIRSLGMTAVAVSKLLGISQSAITRAAYRGEAIAAANSLELVERQNA